MRSKMKIDELRNIAETHADGLLAERDETVRRMVVGIGEDDQDEMASRFRMTYDIAFQRALQFYVEIDEKGEGDVAETPPGESAG
jgi:hypothetical protein